MRSALPAPPAILLQLDLSDDEFLVLAGPIVDSFTLGAGHF